MKSLIYSLTIIICILIGCSNSYGGNQEQQPELIAETCQDNILNQDEEDVDCGGVCAPCVIAPLAETCQDNIKNQDKEGVDCGGVCSPCVIAPPAETCQDNIQNQDEEGVDCGGVCSPCITELLPLEAGNYRGTWNSSASNGSDFLGLKITARITKISNTEYTGTLYISNNFTSCCGTPGSNGDGEITITIIDGAIAFKWDDKIPNCNGVFNGTGTYVENNKIVLSNLTGNDCDGSHVGDIELSKI